MDRLGGKESLVCAREEKVYGNGIRGGDHQNQLPNFVINVDPGRKQPSDTSTSAD